MPDLKPFGSGRSVTWLRAVMRSFETIIVGSGPSATAAARVLNRPGTAVFDIGRQPANGSVMTSLTDAKVCGDVRALLGSNWQSLDNLADEVRHPKLRAENVSYAIDGEPIEIVDETGTLIQSLSTSAAFGGLANAWGAQLYRYTDEDLKALGDWPITAAALAPFYEDLERHIGLSGTADDLDDYFGHQLLTGEPIDLVPTAKRLLRRYSGKRAGRGARLALGLPRLGVLTRPHGSRPAHGLNETEFFETLQPGIYTPRRTWDDLRADGRIEYIGGVRVDGFMERADRVEVDCTDICSGEKWQASAGRLLLGAGVINSTRLVASSLGWRRVELPFLEHPPTLLPLFSLLDLGASLPQRSFPVQLAGRFRHDNEDQLVSVYYAGGTLRSDFVFDLPLPLTGSLRLFESLLGGMLVAQIWTSARPHHCNRFRVDDAGRTSIVYGHRPHNDGIPKLVREFFCLGFVTSSGLAKHAIPGWGFHYAGTMPMSRTPGPEQCDLLGRPTGLQRTHVIDGSLLPSLPAKNISLTVMANAARIAQEISA
jgi:choline dehydrogenase-like flavoprotein